MLGIPPDHVSSSTRSPVRTGVRAAAKPVATSIEDSRSMSSRVASTRRQLLLGAFGLACAPSKPHGQDRSQVASVLTAIERRVGGRLGVCALDVGTGRQLGHREDERFAMCSTFKWLLGAAVLASADRGQLSLGERVAYGPGELLEYAPVTREHVDEGAMTIEALAEAAVIVSDNTAANLLLARTGGPPAFTRFCRALGDRVTRLDRDEPSLNENVSGDPRDTTTPRAMVALMRQILCGDALSRGRREQLLGWLQQSETGKHRLRAGLPGNWTVGDKTGSGSNGAVNDVAIATPPDRSPILIAVYLSEGKTDLHELQAAHVDVARLVARELE